jgi:hypothetical protein
VGLWDVVRGRTAPRRNQLDALFLVPSAAVTLQTAAGLMPTGSGSVCYRSAAGAAFAQTQDEIVALLRGDPDAPDVTVSRDGFGFTWLVVDGDPADLSGLCTGLHAVNTTLELHGFASGLLCSLVPFAGSDGRRVGLVYLYKQGTFYAFAPSGPRARDNLLELSVRNHLAAELPMEDDVSRWLAVWDAPGLSVD